MTPYGDINWVNIGSGNGLLPDGTKPLPEPMLTQVITEVLWHLHDTISCGEILNLSVLDEFENYKSPKDQQVNSLAPGRFQFDFM